MIRYGLIGLLLTGCAAFTEPVREDRVAEQDKCLESALCRTFINDNPSWTERYVSDRDNCAKHAEEIARYARADGLEVFFLVGDVKAEYHAVAVVIGPDGKAFVFDNGLISERPFPLKEINHWMSNPIKTLYLNEDGV